MAQILQTPPLSLLLPSLRPESTRTVVGRMHDLRSCSFSISRFKNVLRGSKWNLVRIF